jgi:hypothetical protein
MNHQVGRSASMYSLARRTSRSAPSRSRGRLATVRAMEYSVQGGEAQMASKGP